MTNKLEYLFTELKKQKNSTNTIISSMQEGLLVIDKNSKITIANESVKKILNTDSPENVFYWIIIRNLKFEEIFKKVQRKNENITQEIEMGENCYIVSITPMNPSASFLVIFHDITQIKNIEQMKKDFISNVSHELKTPLTSIKGFIETIEDEIPQNTKPYLEIIKRNTERLINIVKDLLIISEIENKSNDINIENVNIKELFETVIKIFENKIKTKNIRIKTEIKEDSKIINADKFKIEQVIINLIDNAIKYNKEKGEIIISVTKEKENSIIKIKDTGIGISEKDLNRIFERFYVANKSRSKKMGGTGLGLSIVKHIIHMHNGSLDVESNLEKGTLFTVKIPLTKNNKNS